MRETKTLALIEAKAADADEGAGTVEGYASTFSNVDSYGDTIEPGAYKATIPEFLRDGFVAWGHDWMSPIATPLSAVEDQKGLFLKAEFHTDAAAQRARVITAERIDRGKTMGLSIGYEPEEWEFRKVDVPVRGRWGEFTDKVRVLKKIKLFEVSLVTVPADGEARVTDAKNGRYAEHGDRVLDTVRDFLTRTADLSSLRAKEGRVLSAANRQKLTTLLESLTALDAVKTEIEELLSATEPAKDAPDGASLFAAYQRTLAVLNGVALQ